MQKKLMAVAVAGALAAPALAFAQASTVQIYGNIRTDYNFVKQGAGLQRVDGFSVYDSSLGVRGEEKLGGGLTAWFQCESTANITGEAAETFCNRNSGVGIRGSFGNVFYGNWDTPFKLAHGTHFRPFSTSGSFGLAEILYGGSTGNGGNGLRAVTNGDTVGTSGTGTQLSGFSRRQANTVNYHSPNWNGLRLMGAFSATDENTGVTAASTATKARLWSVGGIYTNGPLAIGAGYERHKNYNPGSQGTYTGGDDTAWQINAGYTFAKVLRVGATYVRLDYDTALGGTAKRSNYGIYADWAIQGPHSLRLGYSVAGDQKGATSAGTAVIGGMVSNGGAGSTGAKLFGIQYAYAFSKRTELNIGYAKLSNESAARYNLQSMPARPAAGEDPTSFTIGVRHSF